MRLTAPQAIALAHWQPGVAAYFVHYRGGPTVGTIGALFARGLLGGIGRYELTMAGRASLAFLVATEAVIIPDGCVRLHCDARGSECGPGCYLHVRGEWDMSRVTRGATPQQVREALAWAPEAA